MTEEINKKDQNPQVVLKEKEVFFLFNKWWWAMWSFLIVAEVFGKTMKLFGLMSDPQNPKVPKHTR